MDKPKIVLDSNPIIDLLNGRITEDTFHEAVSGCLLFASVITRIELLGFPGITGEEERRIHTFLSNVVVLPIDDAIEKNTILLRRANSKIKLPDCIIAATSIVLNAILLTDDKDLKNLVWPGYQVKPI